METLETIFKNVASSGKTFADVAQNAAWLYAVAFIFIGGIVGAALRMAKRALLFSVLGSIVYYGYSKFIVDAQKITQAGTAAAGG